MEFVNATAGEMSFWEYLCVVSSGVTGGGGGRGQSPSPDTSDRKGKGTEFNGWVNATY